jgi:hypothetical protein
VKNALLSILFSALACAALSQAKNDSLSLPTKAGEKAVHKIDSVNASLRSKIDSLQLPGESTVRSSFKKADSIRSGLQAKADSLQLAYQKPLNMIDSASKRLRHRIDSLQMLKLPTDGLTSKLDSVNNLGSKKIAELNQKVEKLKSKATESLKSLKLPPAMQSPVDKLQQSVSDFKVPVVNGKIPDLGIGRTKLPSLDLPKGLNAPSVGNAKTPGVDAVNEIKELKNLANETKELSNITKEAGTYGGDIKNISQGKLSEVKNIDKVAESEAKKIVGSKELDGMTGDIEKYKKQLGGRPDSAALSMAKEQAKEMVMKEATNHFAGKEEILKGAMDKMAKLKSKYSEVKSMADLPKRLPNPLKGKPLRERLVPGITLQFLSDKTFRMDFNPSIAYRLRPRLKAGIGWNERITFASWQPTITDRVYGLRSFGEFALPRGFQARADIELLNAVIPPLQMAGVPDSGRREWEWSMLVGLKKEFKVYKSITGNVQTLYRLWSDHDRVPFPDRLMVRMGFEFRMKKKVKSKAN